MIEAMAVLFILNLGFSGYNFYCFKRLETVVLFGNFPSEFPADSRPDPVPVLRPRAGGQIRKAPIARNDEELFRLENDKK
jgi:hypothetical protein